MIIRNMAISDYDEMHAFWLSIPGLGLVEADDSRDGIAKYLLRNPATSFVAEENGAIIGTIMAGHDGRRGFIYHTAVHPGSRREGIGKGLVNAALESLRREGITKTALVCFRTNTVGNAFWQGCGFEARDDLVYRGLVL